MGSHRHKRGRGEGGQAPVMAIFKANYVKRGTTAKALAKASVRYNQHRPGKDGERITRTLFGSDGVMTRHEAYQMIDEAQKGSLFYRFILSPDPKREDSKHDLDMRDIARQTILALEERIGEPILWVGAIHDDHAPHLHAHLVAIVPTCLYVQELEIARQATTGAALEQRHFLDLMHTHERERPYPLPTFAATHRNVNHPPRSTRGTTASTGLKYASLGKSSYAKKQAKAQQTYAFWRSSRGSPPPGLSACTCPRCQTLHIHTTRNPVHSCSCGLTLHRQKQLTLTQRQPASTQAGKGAGWER
jgi:hypothetical protein